MLGARNEAVRRYTDFVGSMETVYYQYGGKEERHLNGNETLLGSVIKHFWLFC